MHRTDHHAHQAHGHSCCGGHFGAHAGVLVKNAEALQVLESVDTLVIDKTGTLTEKRSWPNLGRSC